METKTADPILKSILAKNTPAVPVADWSAPNTSLQNALIAQQALLQENPSNMIVNIPGVSTADPYINITLQNCVSTIDLKCQLNLTDIHTRSRTSEYNPSKFNGVTMKITEPRTTALIFKSGKIICTGARCEQDSLLASKKFAKIIAKLGYNVKFAEFKIRNIVATCDLRFPIKLENLNQVHWQFSSYETELFSGLIYRMVKPRVVLLIFANGKIVFTGGKTRQDIKEAFDNIYPILKSYRKN